MTTEVTTGCLSEEANVKLREFAEILKDKHRMVWASIVTLTEEGELAVMTNPVVTLALEKIIEKVQETAWMAEADKGRVQ